MVGKFEMEWGGEFFSNTNLNFDSNGNKPSGCIYNTFCNFFLVILLH